jgi:hypothetical protein
MNIHLEDIVLLYLLILPCPNNRQKELSELNKFDLPLIKCHLLPESIEEMNKTKLCTFKDIKCGRMK